MWKINILILLSFIHSTAVSAQDKKVFRYNETSGVNSLDPAFANKTAHGWVCNELFNGLFHLDADLEAHPDLVDGFHHSADGKMYSFTIKKGVKFHDNPCFSNGKGREVKSKDFVYSFKRIIDFHTGSTGAWVFNDKVLRNEDGSISDTCFKVVDDYTFHVYLRKPHPSFLQLLAMPYTFVVPEEAILKYDKSFSHNPVGTGAFTLQEWSRTQIVLSKNPHYFKKDKQGKSLPYLDEVQILLIPDKNEEFQKFIDGDLDFISNISAASRDYILNKDGTVKPEVKEYFKVDLSPYLNTEYVGFYLEGTETDNPFLNKKIRQAMHYAINKKEMLQTIRNGFGYVANSGIVPIALHPFDSTKVLGYEYNFEKAKELLKQAGYPYGQGLPVFKLNTYSNDMELAKFLQREWEAIGLKVKIEENIFSQHLSKVNNGKDILFRASWIGDYPDAENFLAMFYSRNFTPTGPNKTHFKNEDFDKLFEEAHENLDLQLIYQDYLKMDALIMKEAVVIPLYYDELIWLKQKNIKGLKINAMNDLYLENVDISLEAD
jgi:ABC-type transport system substrate-binding protein